MKNIDNIMEKKMTRKEFIKIAGLALLLIMIVPSMVTEFFKETQGWVENKLYVNDEVIMEIK